MIRNQTIRSGLLLFCLYYAAAPLYATAQEKGQLPPGIKALSDQGPAVGDAKTPARLPAALALKKRPVPLAKGVMSVESSADGGWVAEGHMLILSQRGIPKSSAPMRPYIHIPAGAVITSVYWRIVSGQPLPTDVSLAACMPGKCLPLQGQSGRSDGLAGQPADNPLVLTLSMAGRGAITPPAVVKYYQLQINYRTGASR
jgi:flagellar protein FlhE